MHCVHEITKIFGAPSVWHVTFCTSFRNIADCADLDNTKYAFKLNMIYKFVIQSQLQNTNGQQVH